jgi:ribose transport system substrate-binding protein
MTAVNAALAKYSAEPKLDLTPLTAKPAGGRNVVYLANSNAPTDVTNGKAFSAGAKLLGWTPSTINYAGDPATLSTAIQQAIGNKPKPAAIVISGQDPSRFTNALAQASAAGVPVFDGAVPTDPTGMSAKGLSGVSIGKNFLTTEGQLAADWILRDSKGGADVAIVTLPDQPTLTTADQGFTGELNKYCSSCKVSTINAQITDIGKALPASVVSNLQSNPKIKYLYFPYGDMSIGVSAALKAASLSPKLVSTTASDGTYADLKAGNMAATLSCSTEVQGFLEADMVARFYDNGQKPVTDDIVPIQIFDSTNDSSPTLPITPADYQAQFEKIWLLS